MESEGNVSQYGVMQVDRNRNRINKIEINVDESNVEEYINLASKLVLIRHRSILLYESYSCDKNLHKFYIFTEYLKNGSLNDELNNRRITKSDIPDEV